MKKDIIVITKMWIDLLVLFIWEWKNIFESFDMDNFNNQSIISIDVNNKNHGISLEKLNPSLEIIIKTETHHRM